MPKLKTHKAAARRFEYTGSGKLVRTRHGKSHLRRNRSKRAAREYDELICELVRTDELQRLSDIPPELVERAKADSWWQMLILHGATSKGWRGRLVSYEAPTYFGMLTAAYTPTRGTSSRPGRRTPPRTRAR